jgi:type II secretory pathway pseudopilin PulG
MSAGRRERGFTLAGALILIAVLGAGMAAYGEMASHAAQRQKEEELLFVGNQFRQAIAAFYEGTPGAVKRFPQKLEQLLEGQRFPVPRRHLRRLYADPMTGQRQWGLVEAPQGGIMGVYSLSTARPIKTGGFAARDLTLSEATRYSDWAFTYGPAAAAPAAASSSENQKSGSPER